VLGFLLLPEVAEAGRPFMTDDPVPTYTGQWTVYAPVVDATGNGDSFGGTLGAEINYGAAEDLEVTLLLPAAFAHDGAGWAWAAGDLQLAAKYRFYHDEEAGFAVAVAPGISLPTAGRQLGSDEVTVFLPLWAQQDVGPWSVFGGGGYTINPGPGNRDYWSAGFGITRAFGHSMYLGTEVHHRATDALGGHASTDLGFGGSIQLAPSAYLIAAGGPRFMHGDRDGFHASAALEWHF